MCLVEALVHPRHFSRPACCKHPRISYLLYQTTSTIAQSANYSFKVAYLRCCNFIVPFVILRFAFSGIAADSLA